MKIRKILYGSLFVVTLLSALSSCEDMMDRHQEYIKEGEIVYSPRPDSIAFHSGKGRIMFRYWLFNSPNVRSVNVYWNNGADSTIIPVTPSTGLDSSNVILENMSEKSYTFDVRTTDQFGNASLTMTGFATSYGTIFENSLFQRKVKSISIEENGGHVLWYSAAENLVANQVRYETNEGTKIIQMAAKESDVLCPGAKCGSYFEYRSMYLPEPGAIDTFALAWVPYPNPFPLKFEYNKSLWTVISYSDQQKEDGGGVGTLLDNNTGTFWHSGYVPGAAPLPHWVVIDMKSAKQVCQIDTRRAGNTDAKTIQYWTSDDPSPTAASWVKIAEGVFTAKNDLLTLTLLPSVPTKRYLKLVLPDSNRVTYTSISEISVFGDN